MLRFKKLLLASCCVAVSSAPAFAFFPPQPRQSDEVVTDPRPGPVEERDNPTPPVDDPPFDDPTTTHPPPVCQCIEPPTPREVPEPATVATALIGLAVFGAVSVRKVRAKRT